MKEKIKALMKKIDSFSDKFNLTKRFPDYFKVWIFRIGLILCFALFVLAFVTNGFKLNVAYIECQEERCRNPLYLCKNSANADLCSLEHTVPEEFQPYLEKWGNRPYLYKDEVIGTRLNFWGKHFSGLSIAIMIACLIINHNLYLWRKG